MSNAINFTDFKITANEDLAITLMAGIEGIGKTYTTRLTYKDCAEFFDVESSAVPAELRMQREADSSRINAIVEYLTSRDNTFFPSVILVVNKLDIFKSDFVGTMLIEQAIIPADADRLFIDGQGRLCSIKEVLKIRPELAMHCLDVKVIVVNTPTIRDSAKFVTQMFSDLHLGLKKPNSSQSIFFDSEKPLNRIAKDLVSSAREAGIPFGSAVSTTGKIAKGQLYNLASVADFAAIMIGESSKSKLNNLLADKASYEVYLSLMTQYISHIYKNAFFLELIQNADTLAEYKEGLNGNVLTCAIGLRALAWTGRSFIEDMLANESKSPNFALLEKLSSLPIQDKKSEIWIKKEIYQHIGGNLKIIKGSEKRLASVICHHIRLLPCGGLV